MTSGGADLHLHSRCSDGTHDPFRVVELARGHGLEAVSLTDHDTIAGVAEAMEAGRRLGVRVLPGVELSAEYRDHEIHLLAYGFDPLHPALLLALRRYQDERTRRAERIVARLNELGVPLSLGQVRDAAGDAAVGRPHLADALLRGGFVSTFQEAFRRYLNPGCPAFIPRARFSLASARETIRRSGGILVLAHPHLNLSSGNIRALAEEGVDGLESEHPKLKPSQSRELKALAEERGMVCTGGSDCHGDARGAPRMGRVRIPAELLERIERAAKTLAAGAVKEGSRVSGAGGAE